MARDTKLNEATRAILVETLLLTFMPKGAPKKPLAIGIGERLAFALPEIGYMRLTHALNDYTGGATYLRACVEGAARIDIDGKEAGVVTAAQAAYAAHRIAAMDARPGQPHEDARREANFQEMKAASCEARKQEAAGG